MIRRTVIAVVSAALMWSLALSNGVAGASVSSSPPATPQVGGSRTSGTDGSIEVVRQIVQCGGAMYAVGQFTQVRNPNSSTAISRNNAFAFSATAPFNVTGWNPNVNGRVDTVECGVDSTYVLLGGAFSSVHGTAVRNLAKVSTTDGSVQPFAFQPGGRVAHMELVREGGAGDFHLLVGGYFSGLLDSRDPRTGAADDYTTPAISGTYQYDGVVVPARRIWNMTVSPNGAAILLTGVFTNVGGQHHEQVVRLNLTAVGAEVSAWSPTELYMHCVGRQPFYAQDAAWSTDMSRIFVATTGFRLYNGSSTGPRTGPCDAAIAYPATQSEFTGHTWINYTGCDSLYSVAADATTVFIGGHQRWISNGDECDRNNTPPGRTQAGLGELSPTTGADQPGPNRGRGLGAADLLRTTAGLWIASDNQANTDLCAGVHNRMGICFLPN